MSAGLCILFNIVGALAVVSFFCAVLAGWNDGILWSFVLGAVGLGGGKLFERPEDWGG